ncbi:uncharacterized protein [Argopecten irradians]|uniref:uncharacterized protein n=1 Tax=Argopecten irradians TaxID=31199 RepID=UPI003714C7B6
MYSACHLTSFCYGVVDSKNDQLVFGFRAESFDRIHVTISPSLKASIDLKTIRKATQESKTVDVYIGNSLDLPLIDRKRLFNVIDKYSEELMEKHSNLNWMDVSPVLSHQTWLEETPCIVIYCSCKGIRPLDEEVFPRELDGVKVDVREGFCSLFSVTDPKEYNDPLRTGISIGGKEMEGCGSLGTFVHEAEDKKSVGFLTCQHVFSSPEIGKSVVQPSLDHYKSNTDPEKTICGKIRSMCMKPVEYNGKEIGVDVAYVAIDNRIPKEFEFPDIPESMITEHLQQNPRRMGQPILHLDNNHIGLTIYKLGQATGLTKGTLGAVRALVNFGMDERFKNVYQVSNKDKAAAEPGDSGCSVFIANKNTLSVIGLLLGGTGDCKTFFVIPIGAALQALEPKLEIHEFSSVNHPHGGACTSSSDTDASTSETAHPTQLSKSVSPFSGKK